MCPLGTRVVRARVCKQVHIHTCRLIVCTYACAYMHMKAGGVSAGCKGSVRARVHPHPYEVGRGERESMMAMAMASALMHCCEKGEDESKDDSMLLCHHPNIVWMRGERERMMVSASVRLHCHKEGEDKGGRARARMTVLLLLLLLLSCCHPKVDEDEGKRERERERERTTISSSSLHHHEGRHIVILMSSLSSTTTRCHCWNYLVAPYGLSLVCTVHVYYVYVCMYSMYVNVCTIYIYGLSDRWDASHQLSLSPGPRLASAPSRSQLLSYSSTVTEDECGMRGQGCMMVRMGDGE